LADLAAKSLFQPMSHHDTPETSFPEAKFTDKDLEGV